MTMDPRVEATLVEFARERLVPPGYTIEDGPFEQHGLPVIKDE